MRPIQSTLLALVTAACVLQATSVCEAGMLMSTARGVNNTPDTFNGYQELLKIDDPQEPGELSLSDFTFYVTTEDPMAPGAFSYTWDSETRYFVEAASPQDLLGEWIGGFIYNGTADIDTYLVKAGTAYSEWKYESGFNLALLDIDATEGGYPWDPDGTRTTGRSGDSEISHISFYGSTTSTLQSVPEPSTLVMFGIGAVATGAFARRKKARK